MNAIMMLHRAMAGYLAAQGGGGGSKYIEFADPAVEAVLMAKGVSSDGIGITTADVEKVTDLNGWFRVLTITSFNELEYFTGLTELYNSNATYNNGQFRDCKALVSVKLPSSLISLGVASFGGCTSLESVGDLSNVRIIGARSFEGCTLKGDISLSSIESIGYGAFYGSDIQRVLSLGYLTTIPSATYISGAYRGVFGRCLFLEKVILPERLTSIGDRAFYDDKVLVTVVCLASYPPELGASAFTNTPIANGTGFFYVPDASVADYQAATNWTKYAAQIKPLSEYK